MKPSSLPLCLAPASSPRENFPPDYDRPSSSIIWNIEIAPDTQKYEIAPASVVRRVEYIQKICCSTERRKARRAIRHRIIMPSLIGQCARASRPPARDSLNLFMGRSCLAATLYAPGIRPARYFLVLNDARLFFYFIAASRTTREGRRGQMEKISSALVFSAGK